MEELGISSLIVSSLQPLRVARCSRLAGVRNGKCSGAVAVVLTHDTPAPTCSLGHSQPGILVPPQPPRLVQLIRCSWCWNVTASPHPPSTTSDLIHQFIHATGENLFRYFFQWCLEIWIGIGQVNWWSVYWFFENTEKIFFYFLIRRKTYLDKCLNCDFVMLTHSLQCGHCCY